MSNELHFVGRNQAGQVLIFVAAEGHGVVDVMDVTLEEVDFFNIEPNVTYAEFRLKCEEYLFAN